MARATPEDKKFFYAVNHYNYNGTDVVKSINVWTTKEEAEAEGRHSEETYGGQKFSRVVEVPTHNPNDVWAAIESGEII